MKLLKTIAAFFWKIIKFFAFAEYIPAISTDQPAAIEQPKIKLHHANNYGKVANCKKIWRNWHTGKNYQNA